MLVPRFPGERKATRPLPKQTPTKAAPATPSEQPSVRSPSGDWGDDPQRGRSEEEKEIFGSDADGEPASEKEDREADEAPKGSWTQEDLDKMPLQALDGYF